MSSTSTPAPRTTKVADHETDDAAAFRRAYATCVSKTRANIATLADEPKSGAFATDGRYFNFNEGFFEIGNWTSSFFTGMALLAYRSTTEKYFLDQLERLAGPYRDKVSPPHVRDTMHDLGFLFSLYSVGIFKITGSAEHRAIALEAASVLAARFHPTGGFIQAWGRMDDKKTDYAGLAIIDCMMNLPLLFWAAQETGEKRFQEIAVRHADATLTHFVRADDSVFHSFRFNPATGAPVGGDNYCGYSTESHWARGTTWAVYGFALAYRHTGDARYLEVSRRLAIKFLALLDAEIVPMWDFRLPAKADHIRDSSAAAIAVCAFDELSRHLPGETRFSAAASVLLARLCSPDYLDCDPSCPGVLKNAQIGDGLIPGENAYRAKNVYTSWGDYYFMEALAARLHPGVGFW